MQVCVPDDGAVLAPATSLVFDDAPWVLGTGAGGSASDHLAGSGDPGDALRFVHPKISNDVAKKVGVCSLRQRLIASSSDMVALSVPAEAFGQSESLTRRLRHILEQYPEGPGWVWGD